MSDPFIDPEECDLTNVPDRIQEEAFDCDIPEVPGPIVEAPPPILPPAGATGPCPEFTLAVTADQSQRSSDEPLVTATIEKPSEDECAWELALDFAFSCQPISASAVLNVIEGATPLLEVSTTGPNDGDPCDYVFDFGLTIPNFCPTLAVDATTTVLESSDVPYVRVTKTWEDRTAPACDHAFDFEFGLPASQCQDLTIVGAINPPNTIFVFSEPIVGESCAKNLAFDFNIPCPDVNITATVTNIPTLEDPVVRVTRAVDTEDVCEFSFNFEFEIPVICPAIQLSASSTTIEEGESPYVTVSQLQGPGSPPNCANSYEFEFGLPSFGNLSCKGTSYAFLLEAVECKDRQAQAMLITKLECGDVTFEIGAIITVHFTAGQGYYRKSQTIAVAFEKQLGSNGKWIALTNGAQVVPVRMKEGGYPETFAKAEVIVFGVDNDEEIEVFVTGGFIEKGKYVAAVLDAYNCGFQVTGSLTYFRGKWLSDDTVKPEGMKFQTPFGTPQNGDTFGAALNVKEKCFDVIAANCDE